MQDICQLLAEQDTSAVGHINTESGFGPFPVAKVLVDRLLGAGEVVPIAPAARRSVTLRWAHPS
jgi:hypothetical protein